MATSLDVARTATAPVSVVVTDREWEAQLVAWAAGEAEWRQTDVRVLRTAGADRIPETIRMEASALPAGLIVVGPVSAGILTELVFGLGGRRAGSAVAVLGPVFLEGLSPATSRRVITVGFHGSPSSEAALRWALGEAATRAAAVRAVLAWSESQYGGIEGAVRIDPHLHGLPGVAAATLVERTVAATGMDGGRVESVARRGNPVRVLADEAIGSSLLVVGAGHSSVHRRELCGTTTLGCVSGSSVPVVVVPR